MIAFGSAFIIMGSLVFLITFGSPKGWARVRTEWLNRAADPPGSGWHARTVMERTHFFGTPIVIAVGAVLIIAGLL